MGWFWANVTPTHPPDGAPRTASQSTTIAPPGCPMHRPSKSDASIETSKPNIQSCPYEPPAVTPSTTQKSSPPSTIAALNPLNYMFSDLSQARESLGQTTILPLERETSSIPRGGEHSTSGNWVYPSPQQMYNALIRKGYADTPQDAIESMVAVHNFLNEGAWAEVVEWERRFASGLSHGWKESGRGEGGSHTGAMIEPSQTHSATQPRLIRFMGRSDTPTPKARMLQVMGWIYPTKFGGPPPFDRHDWYVERHHENGASQEIRYVIDYYSAPPEPTGEPVFYLDIRPAIDRPSAVAERIIRWSRDVWWRASGGDARSPAEFWA